MYLGPTFYSHDGAPLGKEPLVGGSTSWRILCVWRLDGEPVTTEMLHGVYVIVAEEEAQADLAEGADGTTCIIHTLGGSLRQPMV